MLAEVRWVTGWFHSIKRDGVALSTPQFESLQSAIDDARPRAVAEASSSVSVVLGGTELWKIEWT